MVKSWLSQPLIDLSAARCSAELGISVISRIFVAASRSLFCSASARVCVLDREPEQPAAAPFLGRLSLVVNV
jgi:hypothetical protein